MSFTYKPRDFPLFLLLRAFIANVAESRRAYVVDGFLRLDKDSAWCNRLETEEALRQTVEHFSEVWLAFEATKDLRVNERAAEGLGLWLRQIGDKKSPALLRDLGVLVRRFSTLAAPGFLQRGRRAQLERYGQQLIEDAVSWAASDKEAEKEEVEPRRKAEGPSRWDSGVVRLRLVKRVAETHDVTTFEFEAVDGREFSYMPGQSALLTLEIEGKKVRRAYTISSSPTRPMRLHFTIKRVPGGLVSNWLADTAELGMEIDVSGPKGKFSIQNQMPEKVLLLSGGSGVTPMLSMSRYCCDLGLDVDIVFLHMARTQDDLVCAKELESIRDRMETFEVIYGLSRNLDPNWEGHTGRFSAETLHKAVPDFSSRTVYLCGPVEFMDTSRDVFSQAGFDLKNFHFESFGGRARSKTTPQPKSILAELLPTPTNMRLSAVGRDASSLSSSAIQIPPKVVVKEATEVEVVVQGHESVLKVSSDDFLLDALEDAGLEIDSSCRSGSCGTCRAKRIKGDVRFENAGGLTDEEEEEGIVLLCTAVAESNVELEV